LVLPEKVVNVMVPVPEVAFGIRCSRLSGAVQETELVTPVAIVPLDDPKENDAVWVKLVEARFVLIVTAEPASNVPDDKVTLLVRGIVVSASEPLFVPALPIDDALFAAPEKLIVNVPLEL
jgi:hypothetical protein